MKKNERFIWAAEVLAIDPNDHVLEIGCGSGIFIEVIAPKLKKGSITAIDRSATMINKAAKKNETLIQAGKVVLLNSTLAELNRTKHPYHKIFAFNVNLFWTGPAKKELQIIRSNLDPAGSLYLFYQLPPGGNITRATDLIVQHLKQEDFEVQKIINKKEAPIASSCIIAKPGP